jgi:hypothetical protein
LTCAAIWVGGGRICVPCFNGSLLLFGSQYRPQLKHCVICCADAVAASCRWLCRVLLPSVMPTHSWHHCWKCGSHAAALGSCRGSSSSSVNYSSKTAIPVLWWALCLAQWQMLRRALRSACATLPSFAQSVRPNRTQTQLVEVSTAAGCVLAAYLSEQMGVFRQMPLKHKLC